MASVRAIVGFDNYGLKGPHISLDKVEVQYSFNAEERLLVDFWDLTQNEGFES